jgi:hypothetical protein
MTQNPAADVLLVMSSQYLLPCSCGQKVAISPSQAGGQVSCSCGKSLAIPTLRGIRELEAAPERRERPAATWSKLQGAFFAGGMFLATIGALLVALYLYQYARIGGLAVDRSDEFIRGGAAQIDALGPAQLLEVWTHEVLEEGLGDPEPPYWVTAKEKVAQFFWWMKFGGAMVAVGLTVAAVTFFTSRRG